jgi:hypothetical protein
MVKCKKNFHRRSVSLTPIFKWVNSAALVPAASMDVWIAYTHLKLKVGGNQILLAGRKTSNKPMIESTAPLMSMYIDLSLGEPVNVSCNCEPND